MDFEQKLWQFLHPKNWLLRHLLFWLYRYSDRIIYFIKPVDTTDRPNIWHFLKVYLLPDILLVYVNLFVLVPMLLLRKRVVAYLFAAFGLIICYGLVTYFAETVRYADGIYSPIIDFYLYDFMDGVEMVGLSAGLRLLVEYLYRNQLAQSLATENLRTEMAYLKHQITPHFLFNMLNNIAVQAEKYPNQVVQTIQEFSGILRYQIYEGSKEQVSVVREMENLRHYIRIEALRLNSPDITFEAVGELWNVRVAPLLFLPFVENAMKHSAQVNGVSARINVRFWREENTLLFSCQNSKPDHKVRKMEGGIGLPNVRRRLDLLYPDRHVLQITDEAASYNVLLKLKL